MEKFYIPILGKEGVVIYMKHKWQGDKTISGATTGNAVAGIAIASTDGTKHQFIYGQVVSEVADAVDHLLKGNEEYGNPNKYGVYAKLLTLQEVTDFKIPDVTKPCVIVDWKETMGMTNPQFHISGTFLLLKDDLPRWLTRNYNGIRRKSVILDSRGKKVALAKAVENLEAIAPFTLKYDESTPGSKHPNTVSQTVRFR